VAATNTFAGAPIDRAAERRTDDAWVADRFGDPASRLIVIGPNGPWLDGDSPALVPIPDDDAVTEPLFLGVVPSGAALFAVDAELVDVSAPGEEVGLRDAAMRLAPADAALVAYATAMVTWHRNHPRCARCGARTQLGESGHVRNCPECGAIHHPRTDPVVIMLVRDDENDRVLLGRNARWPPGRYSCLAGFVEPGESLEDAVAREVAEEAGVEVTDLRYRSSQPWPFPASLMIGYHASYAGGRPRAADAELESVRWFDRAELADAAAGRSDFHVPPPAAIARRLIDEWLESA
jgi:NAD+ diphosphatase